MAVDSTHLLREVDTIVREGDGIRQFSITLRILTPEGWVTPTRTTLLSMERDYEGGYGDVMVVETTVGYGEYAHRLIPHRDNLFIDVSIQPIYRGVSNDGFDTRRKVKRYRALIMNANNPSFSDRSPAASSTEDMNTTRSQSVEFQLIDEGLYQIRLASVGRLYRQAIPMSVLQSILTETTSLVDSSNQQRVFGVDVVPGYNSAVRQHIIIPHGTPLVAVPSLLQNEAGGIYGTGLGCYLQDGYWKVFPLYDLTRWKKTPKSLTIISVPSNRYFGAERTYRQTGNQVVVVVASGGETNDTGLSDQLNQGNAVRFTQVENLLTYGKTENNRTLMTRNENVYEIQGVELQSGKTHARWAAEGATSNPFKYYTEMAQRNGRYVTVQWQHGDCSLLYPGMPVKYMSVVKDRLATFYGVLLGVHEQRIPVSAGVNVEEFVGGVGLKVFLSRTDNPV